MKVIEELIEIVSDMKNAMLFGGYDRIPGLIERWQSWAEKLEGALEDKKDFLRFRERRSMLKQEIKTLQKRKENLTEEIKELNRSVKDAKKEKNKR